MFQKRLLHSSRSAFNKALTPLTHVKHPEFQRNPAFSKITNKDVEFFKTVLAPNNIVHESDPESTNMIQYNTDWFNLYRGSSSLCLFPTTTEQVSQILKYCNKQKLAVVPQGGNTGVSVRHFDAVSGAAVVDCGVVLEALDQYLEPRGYTVPLDLGAKGSCQLGGNVSTNAGGLRLMRFGNLHGNVLGLEVVLPDGTILENLSTLRKDNTGYDLKQLFIGAEGTLGLVTGVSLLTPRRPKSVNVAMVGLGSFEDVQKAFVMAKEDLSEILSAFEFWDSDSVGVVKSQMMQDVNYPIEGEHAFYALLETQGSKQEHDQEKLDEYLGRLLETGVARDGMPSKVTSLWGWREKIPESISKSGTAMTYDVAMEVPLLYEMVEDAKKHFGDKINWARNLHIMANLEGFDEHGQEAMDEFVFHGRVIYCTVKNNGSITAEHGVGVSKVNYMNRAKSPVQLALMRTIKNAIDPNGIMNPYKVIPEQ
ncbi:hypothetical protein V8B55DRAFT_1493740 [Mucor lusitanicus]